MSSLDCVHILNYKNPFLFSRKLRDVDFLYVVDFCVYDVRVFQSLYLDFGFLLLVAALLLFVSMLAAISLCLSSKTLKSYKKILKISYFC